MADFDPKPTRVICASCVGPSYQTENPFANCPRCGSRMVPFNKPFIWHMLSDGTLVPKVIGNG